ncbi:BatD family protein [Adhaeribacter rhizoryzae]|uniref:BatD family protein n=1 Tax=Adhaeribacter rhizoryzae TaxID=2607907 RepID=UPI001CC202EB|nr:BatD family protein [Adhaeribacter rhizoryzae]
MINDCLKKIVFLSLFLLCLVCSSQVTYAQEVIIVLGPNKIPINEYFTISVTLRNQPLQNLGDFPEIEGFKKSTRTNTTSRIGLGNKTIIEQTITQNYAALDEGKFTLKPFGILVNGKRIASKGTLITILPMAAEPTETTTPPVKEEPIEIGPPESKPLASQSFFSLETDKDEIYVGEGLFVRLAFYLHEAEQGLLDFYDFGQQYPEFLKKLRQKNAWEEAFEPVTEIKPDTIIIRGKTFLKFNLFRKLLYPLSANPLIFPEVPLTMNQQPEPLTFAAPAAPINLITFTSRPKTVTVKPLPPHPLSNVVPVGQYKLKESLTKLTYRTGQSFSYAFAIEGEGNLGAILPPVPPAFSGLEIYPPETKLIRNKISGAQQGTKRFRYNLLARQPGQYYLGNLFRFIYFNPVTSRYDTLRSELVVKVSGTENQQAAFHPEESDPFYKLIREEENNLISLNQFNEIKLYTNVVILFLLCVSLFLFFKKR